MEILNELEVNIGEEQVLRRQGYQGKLTALKSELREIMAQEIEEAYRLFRPRAVYTELTVAETLGSEIRLSNGLVIRVGGAVKIWEGLDYLTVALGTIGSALEDRVDDLFSLDEYPSAVMLDSIGSVAADSVADQVNYIICEKAARTGMMVGPRLSPGYGAWQLKEQEVLFNLVPAQSIGVQLTESYVMIPRKSVSFCVGIGNKLTTRAVNLRCRHCLKHQCQYRT